ncbi:XdhC family protein [Bradyrhizobium sp. UFLA05-112]
MISNATANVEVLDLVAQMKAAEHAFVLATVVRTVSVTAAKAGAKAIIAADGRIVAGWIGGGCARGAVLKAAREALADGVPRMVSVLPENLLAELGVSSGESRDGIRFASNMCPSKGTMDIFVEPVLPHPSLVILGASPVALSLAAQARMLGFHVTLAAPSADLSSQPDVDTLIDGYSVGELTEAKRFVVVSTQGKGDEVALRAAVATEAAYHAFVGSRRKMAALRAKLIAEGVDAAAIDRVKAPAGLDLGAITPEEIAMSILAEITQARRRGQRAATSLTDKERTDHADERQPAHSRIP